MNEVFVKVGNYEILSKIFDNKDFVSINEITSKLEEYYNTQDYFSNKIIELEEDVKENYKRIPVNEQYEVYDKDFI